jgi:hypothetical protein
MNLNPTLIPIAVSVAALLVATLVVLARYRIEGALARAVIRCFPTAHLSTLAAQLGRHRQWRARRDAPCLAQRWFGTKRDVLAAWRCIRDRHGGQTRARAVAHRPFRSATEGRSRGEGSLR